MSSSHKVCFSLLFKSIIKTLEIQSNIRKNDYTVYTFSCVSNDNRLFSRNHIFESVSIPLIVVKIIFFLFYNYNNSRKLHTLLEGKNLFTFKCAVIQDSILLINFLFFSFFFHKSVQQPAHFGISRKRREFRLPGHWISKF